jgi:HSP20 family molecular chaperone IbpA
LNTIIQDQVGGLVMGDDKKEIFLLDIEGLEEWMTQFITVHYDVYDDGIRMDLLETDLTYIVEATTPGYKKEEIMIEVEKNGIHFAFRKDKDVTNRFVSLPVSLCRKVIKATYTLDILEITILKSGEVENHIRNIEID